MTLVLINGDKYHLDAKDANEAENMLLWNKEHGYDFIRVVDYGEERLVNIRHIIKVV